MAELYNVKTRKPEALDGDDFLNALASGTHSFKAGEQIRVSDPDGQAGTVPADKVREALGLGYKIETPTQKAIRDYVEENKGMKGALKVGFGQMADEFAMGLPEMIYDAKGDPIEVAKKNALKKEFSVINNIGGVTGGALSMFAPGAGTLFKGAAKANEALAAHLAEKLVAKSGDEIAKRTAMEATRGFVGKMASKAAGGALEGGIIAMPHAITEASLRDSGTPGERFETAAEGILAGGLVGGLFGGSIPVFKGLGKLSKEGLEFAATGGKKALTAAEEPAKEAARKLAKVMTGVNEDDILHYVQNPDRVNAVGQSHTNESIMDLMDDARRGLANNVEVATAVAKTAGDEVETAYRTQLQELSKTAAPAELAVNILGEQQNLKEKLGSYSEQLYDALSRAEGDVKVSSLKSVVKGQMKELQVVEGSAIIGVTAKKEYARLEQLYADLGTIKQKRLNLTEAKDLIKQMDPDLNFQQGAGEFNAIGQRNGKAFRKFINKQVRGAADSEQSQILNRMTDLSDLLERTNAKFGTLDKAIANTNNIFTPKGKLNLDLLGELSRETSVDFVAPLKEYQRSRELIERTKIPGNTVKEELVPELVGAHKKALADAQAAQDAFEPVRRLSPERQQAIIRQQGFKNASINDRKALEYLSEVGGTDFNELIKDYNTYQAFAKESTNGSRKAVMGGAAGAAIGALLGPVGAAVGGAVGSAAGGVADIYGGKILKKIIDGAPNASGVLFAEKTLGEFGRRLDAIPKVMERIGNATGVPLRTASLGALVRLMHGDKTDLPASKKSDSLKDRMEHLRELNDISSRLAGNPDRMQRLISDMTAGLSNGGAPGIARDLNVKANQAFNYLFKEQPKPTRPRNLFAPERKWEPSASDLSAYEQKVSVVMDPMTVFHELESGTLTKNHVAALKAVYPKLHEVFADRVRKHVETGSKPMGYQQRVKLSLLLGEPLDHSLTPKSILSYQQAYAQQNEAINAKIDTAGMQSDVSRLMS